MFHSPFRPAPILRCLRMEFNVLYINSFSKFYDRMIKKSEPPEMPLKIDFIRDKLFQATLDVFNQKQVKRDEQ